jgi:hypothetical protein
VIDAGGFGGAAPLNTRNDYEKKKKRS